VTLLKTFMDESGIHEGAPVVAVAGYISRPKHWRAWTKDWNKAKKPIKVFHSTDCAHCRGEFDGWDKPRRDAFAANLLPVLPAHELAGIVIGIDMHVFQKELQHHPELKRMVGEPYGACFQWAVSIIMDVASEHGKGERPGRRIGEAGSAFSGDSLQLASKKAGTSKGQGKGRGSSGPSVVEAQEEAPTVFSTLRGSTPIPPPPRRSTPTRK
jgi:hypothetical protein